MPLLRSVQTEQSIFGQWHSSGCKKVVRAQICPGTACEFVTMLWCGDPNPAADARAAGPLEVFGGVEVPPKGKLKLYDIQLDSTYSRMMFDSTWFHNRPVMIHGFAMFIVVSFQMHYFLGCWDSVITVTWWCVMPCRCIQCESLNSALNDLVLSSRWVDIHQGINQDNTRTYYLVRYVLRLHIAQGLNFHLKVSGDRDLTV